jgi:hypothetical protein
MESMLIDQLFHAESRAQISRIISAIKLVKEPAPRAIKIN